MLTATAHALSPREDARILASIRSTPKRKCSSCGRPGHDRRSCGRLEKAVKPFDPWSDLEWEEHDEARRVVRDNPDGMTLEEVGVHLGVTRERVRQIEAVALAKLREGIEGFDTATVDGFTVAILDCERCGSPFVRRGRLKLCELCTAPKTKTPKLRVVKKPPIRLVLNLSWN